LALLVVVLGFLFGKAQGDGTPVSCSLRHRLRARSRIQLPSMARTRG
jgi:hypothetical protein